MSPRIPLAVTVAAALLLLVCLPRDADAKTTSKLTRKLTLDEAIQLAVNDGLEVDIAEASITAFDARVKGARASLFPRLAISADLILWDEAQTISFAPPGAPAGPETTVRDQLTSNVTVRLVQPISGLFVLQDVLALERTARAVAVADRDRSRVDTAARAAEAYLRLLQATAFVAITEKTVVQVEAQLARARVLASGDVLDRVDVLRLEAARDAARQRVLQARSAVAIAGRALALALHLPAGTVVEPVDQLPTEPTEPPWSADTIGALAAKQRPDVIAARKRIEQARLGTRVARAYLFPNVLAVAQYQHSEGSTFQAANSFFVGLTLSWDVWDWGATWQRTKEADARALQAKLAAEAVADVAGFEAERTAIDADTAFQTIALAASGLAAAEEAYRIQTIRYEQGAATTTDVLDAETEVARARTNHANARYEYYLSAARVLHALGRTPSGDALANPTGP